MSCGPKATELVGIVGQTMAQALTKGGAWIVCRPGCAECCLGTFAISLTDAERLAEGLLHLSQHDPARAARVRRRAQAFLARFAASFPGDPASGLLDNSTQGQEQFETFGEDVPCPALDPASQTCDLYAYRPVTCRTFGPALRFPEGEIRACELCYQGAAEDEIDSAAVPLTPRHLEDLREAHTIAAFALTGPPRRFLGDNAQPACYPERDPLHAPAAPVRKPEVMSPAGYWPQLRAAVEAGADSVYFGLKHFSARAKVGFTLTELPSVMRELHTRGVRGYVTFNTLVFEHEIAGAADAIAAIVDAGADALIMQDYGMVRLARQIAPGMEFHASTQMSITDAAGVRQAQELGVQRVTLARELALTEVRSIIEQTSCDLEIFVHGALCVAYSGQCFSSEAWGGRSANRGQCAQACRLPYEMLVDGRLEPLADARYLLSPGDLYGLRQVPEIVSMGVSAMKIEGRYKDADYVALATAAYRKAVDEAAAGRKLSITPVEELQLEQVYSRGSGPYFLTGTNHQTVVKGRAPRHRGVCIGKVTKVSPDSVTIQTAPAHKIAPVKPGDGLVFDAASWRSPEEPEEGGRIFQSLPNLDGSLELKFGNNAVRFTRIHPGDLVWRTHDPALERVAKPYLEPAAPAARQSIHIRVTAAEGAPLVTEWHLIAHPEISTTVISPESIERAQNRGLTKDFLHEQFSRLGNTPYTLKSIELTCTGTPFAASSLLNRLRREAVEQLQAQQVNRPPLEVNQPKPLVEAALRQATAEEPASLEPQLHLLVRTPEQLEAALELTPASITLDYLDLYGLRPSVEKVKTAGIAVRVASPRILKPGEARITNFLLSLECPLVIRSTGILHELKQQPHSDLIGDFSLNTANSLTASAYFELGLSRLTPTHDLNADQVARLARTAGAARIEVVAYQHLPVFHTEHCVFCRFLSTGTTYKDCGRPCETHTVALKDPSGRAHPVMADVGCRNTVFGAEAQEASSFIDQWQEAGIRHFRLEFVHESAGQVREVTLAFQSYLKGESTSAQLAAELKRIAPQGVTQGSLFVPPDYLALPILQ